MSEYTNPGCSLVSDVRIYGLDESIRRSKYPMAVDTMLCDTTPVKTTYKLGSCPTGTGHDNFLKGIIVQFDLTFAVKAWTEAERYHFLEFVSSQSTMHRIAFFDLDLQYDPHVDPRIVTIMKEIVDTYRDTNDPEDYLRCLYSNPCGFRLTAGMTTNYCQLKTIYQQRKDHRLPEWREFCSWVLTLPMFKELCIDGMPETKEVPEKKSNNTLILLVGPSGSGKSTVASMLEMRNGWRQLISYTTRPRRSPEESSHTFISEEDFMRLKDLMAYTEYNGYRYGATRQQIEDSDVYVVDIPGVESLVQNYKGNKRLVAFCMPLQESQARERMANRGDSQEAIEERLITDRIAFDGMEGKLASLLGIENTYTLPQTASPMETTVMIEKIMGDSSDE